MPSKKVIQEPITSTYHESKEASKTVTEPLKVKFEPDATEEYVVLPSANSTLTPVYGKGVPPGIRCAILTMGGIGLAPTVYFQESSFPHFPAEAWK